jgi:hypothetical protein
MDVVKSLTAALAVACLLICASSARADTIEVNRLDDPTTGACPDDCSLRHAVAAALDGDTVQVGDSAAIYHLTQGSPLVVGHAITIQGDGAEQTVIDGSLNSNSAGVSRIMNVTSAGVSISDLQFTHGQDGKDETCSNGCASTFDANGGGALFNTGALTLDHVVFDANSASVGGAISNSASLAMTDVEFRNDGAAFGGGLFVRGTATADRVTFRGEGSGAYGGGAVYMRGGTLTLTNSTVVDSGWASSIGGGIVNQGGNLTLKNVTLAGNVRGALETDGNGMTSVQNTIIGAGFADGSDFACVASGHDYGDGRLTAKAITTDQGYNLDEDGSCALTGTGDLPSHNAHLAPIAHNDGFVYTEALLHGSDAIDTGNDAACPATDGQGDPRPQPSGGHCDIGAFEAVLRGAPDATTEDVAGVGSTDALLQATINLAGEAGGYHFIWGTSPTALTNSTPIAAAGILSAATVETQELDYLDPSRTYYYKAVADNATGDTTAATVKQFTTSAGPPAVSDTFVSDVTDTTATVHFTIDPEGADTTYVIQYDDGSAEGQTQAVDIGSTPGPQQLTQTLTGLDPGSSYVADVIASNSEAPDGVEAQGVSFDTAQQLSATAGLPVELSDNGDDFDGCPTASVDWGDGSRTALAHIECSDDGDDGDDYVLTESHTYSGSGHFHIVIDYGRQGTVDQYALVTGGHTLTVAPGGNGTGRVTGSGIDCPGTCSQLYVDGTDVTLTATPAAGSSFAGWGGTCHGTEPCTVTLDADTAVTATFTAIAAQASVTPTPTPAPAPTATPTPPPAPTFHQTVVVAPVSGKVLVKRKGSKTFVPLDATQGIPLGTEVDVTNGKIQLTSVPKAGAKPETATFYDGIFTVTQSGSITVLTLSGPAPTCTAKGKASTATTKKKVKSRKLWGDGSGSFRTRGQYSAATVRGTQWLVQDSCAGTLTRVTRGLVAVNDTVRHKTILVKGGHSYLARPHK